MVIFHIFNLQPIKYIELQQLILIDVFTCISIVIFKQMMSHKSMQVRCSMDQPIQLLVDKLASKSSDLYIFWQNYNQLYHAYNEKLTEVHRLQLEIQTVRKEKVTLKAVSPPPEQTFFKERFLYMEKSCEDLKLQMERLRGQNRQLKRDNQKFHQENFQLQNLLQQLRQQNSLQRNHIEKILNQLKNAQNQVNAMTKVYEQLGQKQMIVSKYVERERQLMDRIQQLQSQIDAKNEDEMANKLKYEKIVKESMINAKHKVIESLPGMVQASKHKVQIISP